MIEGELANWRIKRIPDLKARVPIFLLLREHCRASMDGYAPQGNDVDFISHSNGTVLHHHIGAIRTLVEVDQLLFVLWTFFPIHIWPNVSYKGYPRVMKYSAILSFLPIEEFHRTVHGRKPLTNQ